MGQTLGTLVHSFFLAAGLRVSQVVCQQLLLSLHYIQLCGHVTFILLFTGIWDVSNFGFY